MIEDFAFSIEESPFLYKNAQVRPPLVPAPGNLYKRQKPQFAPDFGSKFAYIFPGVGIVAVGILGHYGTFPCESHEFCSKNEKCCVTNEES